MKVEEEIKKLKKTLHNSMDFASRIMEKNGVVIGFVYLKSITDNLVFSQAIYEPVLNFEGVLSFVVLTEIIKANDVTKIKNTEIVDKILKGNVVILLSNSDELISIEIMKFNMRSPSEPPTSPVIMGPREGFTEDIKTNITLIRRHFYSPQLVFEDITIGRDTQTQVVLAYLDDIADKRIVKDIKKKLSKIDIDGVVDSYYLVELLSNRPKSLLKQIGSAEKPDIVAAKMLEGRVAIWWIILQLF